MHPEGGRRTTAMSKSAHAFLQEMAPFLDLLVIFQTGNTSAASGFLVSSVLKASYRLAGSTPSDRYY